MTMSNARRSWRGGPGNRNLVLLRRLDGIHAAIKVLQDRWRLAAVRSRMLLSGPPVPDLVARVKQLESEKTCLRSEIDRLFEEGHRMLVE